MKSNSIWFTQHFQFPHFKIVKKNSNCKKEVLPGGMFSEEFCRIPDSGFRIADCGLRTSIQHPASSIQHPYRACRSIHTVLPAARCTSCSIHVPVVLRKRRRRIRKSMRNQCNYFILPAVYGCTIRLLEGSRWMRTTPSNWLNNNSPKLKLKLKPNLT